MIGTGMSQNTPIVLSRIIGSIVPEGSEGLATLRSEVQIPRMRSLGIQYGNLFRVPRVLILCVLIILYGDKTGDTPALLNLWFQKVPLLKMPGYSAQFKRRVEHSVEFCSVITTSKQDVCFL
jgi:hypothetical protein